MKCQVAWSALATAFAPLLALAQIPEPTNGHWVDTWASMPQLTESSNLPPAPFNTTTVIFQNATIRQTLHLSLGASTIRLRFSNAFGLTNLPISAVTIALPTNGSAGVSGIQSETLQNVTFSGASSFSLPNGALLVSDPISIDVEPQSMITVSMFLESGQQGVDITSHPGSRTTSFFVNGNAVAEQDLADAASAAHWYFVSAVEAWAPQDAVAFAIVGDSITDGRGSDDNENDRWPDLVLARMQNNTNTSNIAVINQAAGGNRILADGLGPNAIGRIDRDVLAHSGVKYAMIFEGVNDIGVANNDAASQTAIGDQLLIAYQQIITRVHALGIPIFAATITPFGNNAPGYADPIREQTRQRINEWIKTSGKFDAVVDFDAVVRDPDNATVIAAQFDSGDGLHPNAAGYHAIAEAFPLDIFGQFAEGVSGFV
ncbi:extracellular GDSL-like lipase/acylhydrolase [Peniophora sp. CONT]|nr:extracellular GDSL-like lipase/acylhydrolase [Peniophora sp. CONT]